ncbi:lymphocyte antigen 6 complex locus protein G6c [Notamacropus eugenii]|uniref:lymphocyte antigen 6 complex locus protein G6c n=1 Tax=Notamacropus eugenii TaxID=9315 RepID=UPI003B685C20
MNAFLLLSLSALVCWASADIRCHSCNKFPVVGCVDRKSCLLDQGHQCLSTDVYLGKMWLYSKYRCGSATEPCIPGINRTNELTYNTTCCRRDSCNSFAPRPSPVLSLSLLTPFAGLGFWLLH